MKPKEIKMIIPKPYMQVGFRCTNRSFYQIENDLWEICTILDPNQEIDLWNKYISKSSDYEGDLDKITLYNEEGSQKLLKEIFLFYTIEEKIPDIGIDIILTCY